MSTFARKGIFFILHVCQYYIKNAFQNNAFLLEYLLFSLAVLLEIQSPVLQFKRFRGKINIQRPRKPHYDRALFNAVTKPVYPRSKLTEECFQWHQKAAVIRTDKVNPYEQIIAKEAANWFAHSKFVAIFHVNSILADDMFKARVSLFKQNMHVKVYGRSILQQALGDTKFKAILPLFEAKNCIVFSPDQKLQQLLKIVKKIPQLTLLAGIVENRLLSKTELTNFAALPTIDVARAQLVAVLQNAGGNNIVNSLQTHQTNLCQALDAYAKSEDKTSETSDSSSEKPAE